MKKGINMNKKVLKLLYLSFDKDLNKKEQKQLAEALKTSEELRQEKKQIEIQRSAISNNVPQSFSPHFAERVMNSIQTMKENENGLVTFYKTLKTLFWRLAVIGAIGLIALMLINLTVGENLLSKESFYVSNMTFEEILQIPLF